MVLQPNCSELVTNLGCKKTDEVIEALRKVKKMDDFTLVVSFPYRLGTAKIATTGDTLTIKGKEQKVLDFLRGIGVWASMFIPLTDIPIEKAIKKMEIKNGTVEVLEPDKEKILSNFDYEMNKDEKFLVNIARGFRNGGKIELYRGNLKEIIFETEETAPEFNMDCYSLDTLNLDLTGDYAENEYPALLAVMELFGSDYETFDGGHSNGFEEWLEKQGREDMIEERW